VTQQEPGELPEIRISVRPNGPYRVFGNVRMFDDDGNEFVLPEGQWYTLCRCGHSENKPFCDSAHKTCDFHPETRAVQTAE